MAKDKERNVKVIFVDCFDTIILRNTSTKNVFRHWAQELSNIYNIPWKVIYRVYNKTNFKLCLKQLFTKFTLQENFEVVLEKVYNKLSKKYNKLEKEDFVNTAQQVYFQKELETFSVNESLIEFLQKEKSKGIKIYLVSDFYCKSDTLLKWFTSLKIDSVFDKVFSSSDFNKEKATTKIYKFLTKELQLSPKEVIMYGDNLWSDVMMAKACHLNAKRIKVQREKYEK